MKSLFVKVSLLSTLPVLLSATFVVSLSSSFAYAIGEDAFIKMKEPNEVLTGEAQFKDGGFAYHETHTLISKEGRLESLTTVYRARSDAASPAIARMQHAFSAPGFLPDYSYEDLRNKVEHRLTVDRSKNKVTLFRKVDGKEKTETITFEANMATGQGVYFWIVANLDAILKGDKVVTKFVVPGSLDQFPFRARLVKKDDAKITIGIALESWLLNLFLSKLEFDIDAKTNRLLEYRGTSNVADDKGEYRDVVIKY